MTKSNLTARNLSVQPVYRISKKNHGYVLEKVNLERQPKIEFKFEKQIDFETSFLKLETSFLKLETALLTSKYHSSLGNLKPANYALNWL